MCVVIDGREIDGGGVHGRGSGGGCGVRVVGEGEGGLFGDGSGEEGGKVGCRCGWVDGVGGFGGGGGGGGSGCYGGGGGGGLEGGGGGGKVHGDGVCVVFVWLSIWGGGGGGRGDVAVEVVRRNWYGSILKCGGR